MTGTRRERRQWIGRGLIGLLAWHVVRIAVSIGCLMEGSGVWGRGSVQASVVDVAISSVAAARHAAHAETAPAGDVHTAHAAHATDPVSSTHDRGDHASPTPSPAAHDDAPAPHHGDEHGRADCVGSMACGVVALDAPVRVAEGVTVAHDDGAPSTGTGRPLSLARAPETPPPRA